MGIDEESMKTGVIGSIFGDVTCCAEKVYLFVVFRRIDGIDDFLTFTRKEKEEKRDRWTPVKCRDSSIHVP